MSKNRLNNTLPPSPSWNSITQGGISRCSSSMVMGRGAGKTMAVANMIVASQEDSRSAKRKASRLSRLRADQLVALLGKTYVDDRERRAIRCILEGDEEQAESALRRFGGLTFVSTEFTPTQFSIGTSR